MGPENRAGGDPPAPGIPQQPAAEFARKQDGANLTFQRNGGRSRLGGLHRDIGHLADPDAGGADGLHQQGQALPAQGPGRLHQAAVILPAQLPLRVLKATALDPQGLDPAFLPPHGRKEAVDTRQYGVDRCGGMAASKMRLPSGRPAPAGSSAAPRGKGPDAAEVICDGPLAVLLCAQGRRKHRCCSPCDLMALFPHKLHSPK